MSTDFHQYQSVLLLLEEEVLCNYNAISNSQSNAINNFYGGDDNDDDCKFL